jgi:hypothetical protein
MIQFISTLDHCVRNLLEFIYGHAQNGEPCSESWEDVEVKSQCVAYTDGLCSGPKAYRNRHGPLCKKLDVPQTCHYYSN